MKAYGPDLSTCYALLVALTLIGSVIVAIDLFFVFIQVQILYSQIYIRVTNQNGFLDV